MSKKEQYLIVVFFDNGKSMFRVIWIQSLFLAGVTVIFVVAKITFFHALKTISSQLINYVSLALQLKVVLCQLL